MPSAPFTPPSAAVLRLADRAVLEVSGEEARSWLQGQITNDVSKLGDDGAVYTLLVNVRGKILADAFVVTGPDKGGFETLRLILPADRIQTLLEHLDAYIIMEDVELAALDLHVWTVQGPSAAEVIDGLDARPCDRVDLGGFDLLVAPEESEACGAELVARAEAVGGGAARPEALDAARFAAGIPAYGVDYGEKNYPQEAGLRDRAVSFVKGCYLGQEVVCTLENRGQLRRRMVLLEAEAIAPGDAVHNDEGAEAGRVTSVHEGLAFALLKRSLAEADRTVALDDGRTARIARIVGETTKD